MKSHLLIFSFVLILAGIALGQATTDSLTVTEGDTVALIAMEAEGLIDGRDFLPADVVLYELKYVLSTGLEGIVFSAQELEFSADTLSITLPFEVTMVMGTHEIRGIVIRNAIANSEGNRFISSDVTSLYLTVEPKPDDTTKPKKWIIMFLVPDN